jgi:hypothetical protein
MAFVEVFFMPTKELLEKRLDDHYTAQNAIAKKAAEESRELTVQERAEYNHHSAEILVLKQRIWDEFDGPEFKAESKALIKAQAKKKLLDEIRAFQEKYS